MTLGSFVNDFESFRYDFESFVNDLSHFAMTFRSFMNDSEPLRYDPQVIRE